MVSFPGNLKKHFVYMGFGLLFVLELQEAIAPPFNINMNAYFCWWCDRKTITIQIKVCKDLS
jgi:hypothetical protein